MSASDATPAAPPKPRRRWLQYSLRTLFVIVTLLAFPFYQAAKWYQAMIEEEQAIATLSALSDEFLRHQKFPNYGSGDFRHFSADRYPVGDPDDAGSPPTWFRKLFGMPDFTHVKQIDLHCQLELEAARAQLQELVRQGSTKRDAELRSAQPTGRTRYSRAEVALLHRMPRLKTLTIEGAAVEQGALDALSGHPSIDSIVLGIEPGIYLLAPEWNLSDGLAPLATVPALRSLTIYNCDLTEPIDLPPGYEQLQSLRLVNCVLTDDSLTRLRGLTRLEQLELTNTESKFDEDGTLICTIDGSDAEFRAPRRSELTDKGLAHLSSLPNLRKLVLYQGKIAGRAFSQFARSPLESLELHLPRIDPQGIKALAACASLKSLRLSGVDANALSIISLANLPNLTSLTVNGRPVPKANVKSAQ